MLKDSKPKVSYIKTPYIFGAPCNPLWVCESRFSSGYGKTPKQAYDKWAASKPGVLNRVVTAFADAIGESAFIFLLVFLVAGSAFAFAVLLTKFLVW